MKIADQPNLVGTLIAVIVAINIGIALYLKYKKGISDYKITIILLISLSLSLSLFLYVILKDDGFSLLYAIGTFIGLFVFMISYIKTTMRLHKTFFKKNK